MLTVIKTLFMFLTFPFIVVLYGIDVIIVRLVLLYIALKTALCPFFGVTVVNETFNEMSVILPELEEVMSVEAIQSMLKFKKDHKSLTEAQLSEGNSAADYKMNLFSHHRNKKSGAIYHFIERDEFMDFLPIRVVETLGKGCSGEVKLIENIMHPGYLLAAKDFVFGKRQNGRLKRSDIDINHKGWIKFKDETALLQGIKHKFIVQHTLSVACSAHATIFMEFCNFGPLYRHIHKLNNDVTKLWFLQIVSAVNYLHQKNIVHRDIKLDNILVRRNKTIALADFGMSEKLEEGQRLVKGRKGTLVYRAPELQVAGTDRDFDGYKADAFSLGVVLLCMASHKDPEFHHDIFNQPHLNLWLKDPMLIQCLWVLLAVDPEKRGEVTVLAEDLGHSGFVIV